MNTAARPQAQTSQPIGRVWAANFRRWRVGSGRGHVDLLLETPSIRIRDAILRAHLGLKWIDLPRGQIIGANGRPRLTASGKPIFRELVEFRGDAAVAFTAAAVAAVVRRWPDAFNDNER